MHILILIFSILFLYGAFSTIFHSTEMVGQIGKVYGETNIRLFGYLAYVDLLILLYPLLQIYRNKRLSKDIEFYLGWILLLISFILLQALLVNMYHGGSIGLTLYNSLYPYVGKAGLWLLWILATSISCVLILDEIPNPQNIVKKFFTYRNFVWEKVKPLFSNIENPFFDKTSTDKMTTIVAQRRVRKRIQPKNVKAQAPKKIVHQSKKRYSSNSEDEISMLEDRPIEDIVNIEIKASKASKPSTQSKPSKISKPVKKAKTPKKPKSNKKDKPLKQTRLIIEDVKSEVKEEEIESEEPTSFNTPPNIIDELDENKQLLDALEKGEIEEPNDFELPPLEFLEVSDGEKREIDEDEIDTKIDELIGKLKHFKISGEVMRTYSGPLVTTFEFKPAANVKVSKIMNLQDDLAMALRAETIRIQAPIPGKDVVGIEIPNDTFETIYLRDILESEIFTTSKSPLTIAMGKDIVGNAFVTDLKKLPHLLIAGTTGSGKSVGINAMILSLLYRNDPDSLKLMLIDPKMLEFSIYNDIPHLITPVITDSTKAIAALSNMVGEMERRYQLMAASRTKNIDNYNEKIKKKGGDPMPFIVVIIDELADLMMNGGKDVEYSIARLAQMARASGIHLIVATQRPSVDVVTGLIKANLPSRLSYRVGQRIDSKVILDALGADSLLGRGDALFTPPGTNGLVRIHAPWNSEEEIEDIVEFLKAQRAPDYDERYLVPEEGNSLGGTGVVGDLDELYDKAKEIIITDQKTSISYLQRKLQIGYNRSANIIEQLQEMGVLSSPNNKGQREIIL